MKRVFTFILFIYLSACSEEFNINAPHQDIYVLNCILRKDQSIQYAIFSKNTFTENGIPPDTESTAQNIAGADIKIFNNGSVYVMRDTTMELSDPENTLVDCYYVKNMPIIPGKDIRIEASIPGGELLESTVSVPSISYSAFSSDFPQVYRAGYQERPAYKWSWGGRNQNESDILNLPELEIYYQKHEEGTFTDKRILVPLASHFLLNEKGELVPVNAELSFSNYCTTTLEIVNKTMQGISEDDPNKSNYIINKVLFSVNCFDSNLSRFYSAYHSYEEDFTIKIRQTDFTNIEGGRGIFGLYYKFKILLIVDRLYISSFGYKYDPP